MYDHRSTYLCEWQDSSHFVVGLQGDHQIADPGAARWHLDGGWHCTYDAAHGKALANKYTDSKNSEFEFY